MIKIKRIGLSVPKLSMNQEEVYNFLKYNNKKFKLIFENSKISKRHFIINKDDKLPILDNEYYYKRYTQSALELSKEAINNLKTNIKDIKHLQFVSSTGMLCPGLGFHLIKDLGFNEDTEVYNIIGHGCNGTFWGIQNSINFLTKNKNQESLVVTVETCSITCYNDNSLENVIANAIFSDGAASVLLEESEKISKNDVIIIDAINLTKAHSIDLLGFRNKYGTLRVNLSIEVPEVIKKNAYNMVLNLLKKNNVKINQIKNWSIHPGGKKILKIIEEEFNLNNGELKSSWKILNDYGNMSSPTVLFVLNEELKVMKKGYGIMMGFGPGLSLNAILIKKV